MSCSQSCREVPDSLSKNELLLNIWKCLLKNFKNQMDDEHLHNITRKGKRAFDFDLLHLYRLPKLLSMLVCQIKA